ncbi:hypothetical protein [Paenibacillus thermotolerans]|uniref:hypothetical protein n=1 Tax=Paenibacillus thermotolerans TaxID=3027807 RepID=UPI00236865D7|nr:MULTISPECIES: hypothetical protein [unclassified Paenibacillus]
MSNRTLPLGIGIIVAGVIILLGKLGVFQAIGTLFWPLILLAAGAALHWGYVNRHLPPVVLLPGAILIGLSLVFLFCAWFGWGWMKMLWPIIPLSVAAGLYELSAAERNTALRTVAFGVGAVSAVLLVITLLTRMNVYLIALILIIVGVVIVARRPRTR